MHKVKCQPYSRPATCLPLGLPSCSLALERAKADMEKWKVLFSLKPAEVFISIFTSLIQKAVSILDEMTGALIPYCFLCSGMGGNKRGHKALSWEEAEEEMQPRARDSQKDMDLIILRSLKSIKKLWKEAGVSSFQIMQYSNLLIVTIKVPLLLRGSS